MNPVAIAMEQMVAIRSRMGTTGLAQDLNFRSDGISCSVIP